MSSTNAPVIEALDLAIATRTPVVLWGSPGTGKTSTVEALAAARSLHCEVVIASLREPTDFAGLPVVDGADVSFAPPAWARRLAGHERSLLFLDELTTAPPAVQAALLRVVLERTVGDLPLGPGVAVVAAANPPAEAADGWELSPPLANRLCHLDWTLDPDAFSTGLIGGFPAPPTVTLPAGWEASDTAGRGIVAGFIRSRPALLSAVPRGADPGRAWPSPRSWETLARLWGAAGAAEASAEARSALVLGCVGEGAGIELLSWVAKLDLPDPEELLANPNAFRTNIRPDRAYALLAAVVAAVAGRPTPERWTAAWDVVAKAAAKSPDVAATAARGLTGCRPSGTPLPQSVTSLLPVLTAARLIETAA